MDEAAALDEHRFLVFAMLRRSFLEDPTDIPAAPRIYDYLSGGSFHFPADRAVAQRMTELVPSLLKWLPMLRAFLHKAAKRLALAGHDQRRPSRFSSQ